MLKPDRFEAKILAAIAAGLVVGYFILAAIYRVAIFEILGR